MEGYRENRQSTSYNFNLLQYYVQFLSSTRCYKGVKITKLLSFSNQIPFSFYLDHLGRSYLSGRYSFSGKRPLATAAMNVELPPFKNEKHNSESACTFGRDITALNSTLTRLSRTFWRNQRRRGLSSSTPSAWFSTNSSSSSRFSMDASLMMKT